MEKKAMSAKERKAKQRAKEREHDLDAYRVKKKRGNEAISSTV